MANKSVLLLFLISFNSFALTFEQWKYEYANRAAKRGISKKFILSNLKDIIYDESVIALDKKQISLDKKLDYKKFIKKWLRESPTRVEQGRKLLKKHYKLLSKIEKEYNVEKEIIISLWGVETFFGQISGKRDLLTSLASLSFEGRRRKFFEVQLNAALRLIKKGHVSRENLKGSWAGATGQCQFMPSNIKNYAVDYNRDGKIDIWNTPSDIFASIANFLKKVHWKKGKSIGDLAINTKDKKLNTKYLYSRKYYRKLGFKPLREKKFTKNWVARRVAYLSLKNSPVILRGSNYKPLLRWNNSSLFAAFNIIMMEGLKGN
jgi:membrane-bound lytic murein transglycosylase B